MAKPLARRRFAPLGVSTLTFLLLAACSTAPDDASSEQANAVVQAAGVTEAPTSSQSETSAPARRTITAILRRWSITPSTR